MEQLLKKLTLDFWAKGRHKISPEKFFDIESGLLLDVRSREEAASISIKMGCHLNIECLNIPVNEIPDRIDEISEERSVAVFCPAGVRSAIVYAYLLSKGFPDVHILEGGYTALTEAVRPGKIFKVLKKGK